MKTSSTEREAIVAWLRDGQEAFMERCRKSYHRGNRASAYEHATTSGHYRCIADAIENGAHIKDQDHGRA